MSQLFAKLFGWFAEKAIVGSLSRSRRFQQFALWTDNVLNTHKKTIKDKTVDVTAKADTFVQTFKKVIEEETKAAQQARISATAENTTAASKPSGAYSSTSTNTSNSSTSSRYTNSASNRVDRIR